LVVSGDIAESTSLVGTLHEMDAVLSRPIYFVLANHDYYHGSVAGTRRSVAAALVRSRFLTYLSGADVVELTPGTALVGHDGWGDARLGDFEASDVLLNDFFLVPRSSRATPHCHVIVTLAGLPIGCGVTPRISTAFREQSAD
jgi:3',5'-cyclic-AMP phosphodiesterase